MACEEMDISYELGKKGGAEDQPVDDDLEPNDAIKVFYQFLKCLGMEFGCIFPLAINVVLCIFSSRLSNLFRFQDKATQVVMLCYRRGLQQHILPVLFDLLTLCERKRLGAFARKITFTIE